MYLYQTSKRLGYEQTRLHSILGGNRVCVELSPCLTFKRARLIISTNGLYKLKTYLFIEL